MGIIYIRSMRLLLITSGLNQCQIPNHSQIYIYLLVENIQCFFIGNT